ncbi:hydrogenase subunit MbhD domain-containing protein [uncultured Corynebacterium sp.]|uniref:hydrogenase subunit MbhD domain-containing protein n=1 Tax=uncultured Corynebacterium sp. TaxID=159447 RepID=UPI0025CB9129|nr:hydrogenase subunit MbhD domain-containing protein [uncultured Corynebacterium sp.]
MAEPAFREVDRVLGVADIVVGVGLLALALGALFARTRPVAVMLFLCTGALMIPTWLRLGTVDMALAEGALGTGILTALLLAVTVDRRSLDDADGATGHENGSGGGGTRLRWLAGVSRVAVMATSISVVAVPGAALLSTIDARDPAFTWSEPMAAAMPHSGVDYAVTAVLLNFRAVDTLLESAVLLFAAIAAASIASAALGEDAAPLAPTAVPGVSWFGNILGPMALLLGGWLLYAGASSAGGAFQAGAVWAGGLVMLHAAGAGWLMRSRRALTIVAVSGVAVFLAAAFVGPITGDAWLALDPAWAGAVVVAVETALALGIAAALVQLYLVLIGREVRP